MCMKHIFSKTLLAFIILVAVLIAVAEPVAEVAEKLDRYEVDTSKSMLYWRSDNHYGIVPIRDGKLSFKQGEIYEGKFTIHMDALQDKDIDYDLMRDVLQNVLRSKEFFHTEIYPNAYFELFKSAAIDKAGNASFCGDLKLLEITKCVQINANFQFINDSLFVVSDSIRIDRTDWGINAMSPNHVKGDEAFIISDTLVFKLQFWASKIIE